MAHELIRGDGSPLQASLVAPGLEAEAIEKATGWSIEFQDYEYRSGYHCVSDSDAAKLRSLVEGSARGDPQLWVRYAGRAKLGARRLLEVARSLGDRELLDGFEALRASMSELVPFIATRSVVQQQLEAFLTERVATGMGGADRTGQAAEALHRLFLTRQESEARRELRSFYRIASQLAKNGKVRGLVIDRSSPRALQTLAENYPDLHEPLLRHVEHYGWLRTRNFHFSPISPKDLVQRLQKLFLRWDAEKMTLAARPQARSEASEVLGFEPTSEIAEGIAVLEDLLNARDLRVDALLHARHAGRRFFDKVATTLECSSRELLLLTAGEITRALAGKGEIPSDELEERAKDLPAATALEGQSVSLGRAVGTVRIISQGAEGKRLGLGDILVTGLSSPDHAGNQSLFPTRTDASAPVEDAAAIVIDDGGLLSHAAMISRELGIPCLVGTETATGTLIDGQVVEVDATRSEGRIVPLEYP